MRSGRRLDEVWQFGSPSRGIGYRHWEGDKA